MMTTPPAESPAPLLIRHGRIIDPATSRDEITDLLIIDGRIAHLGRVTDADLAQLDRPADIIDAEGCLVTPGLLDIHVHLREPGQEHKETISTGAAAAIAGGFTTICCMPNTQPALDSPITLAFIRERAAAANAAHIFTVAAATLGRRGEQLAPIATLAESGAVGFTDDGDGIADSAVMRQILTHVRASDRVFMQHCQDASLTPGGVMNAGPVATRLGLGGWPAVAEEVMLERDLRINRDINCRYHAQHLSSGETVDILRRAQERGQPATGECSPHHLLLTDEACDGYNTLAKMNPPLRTARDIEMLKQGIYEGIISVLATDHAPHTDEEKAADFASAPFGIIGMECALPLYIKALIEGDVLTWPRLIGMMTINAARVVGLDALGYGRLTEGGLADVTIIDPELTWTIDVNAFRSKSRNCPFHGWAVRGRAVATIVGGNVLHQLERV